MKIPLQLFSNNKIRIRLSDEEAIDYAFVDSDNENSKKCSHYKILKSIDRKNSEQIQ
ncbi:hypothetical protein T552_02693 [Pneumocystis carinii B80]|uniref:Uncharacterized protein n=1 Tax=Pneumocystis carinii (strain B80) TaxID=1408658 RepID=A0A0W4ZEB0_PNEC8|nr:hypothetical protein T552_02693 [Pneumocystis carinii B80]KTW26686.1 hypothetical protein T552_02693 [Pneumocystis carinii B80]